MIQSFEPGEDWFYDYQTGQAFDGPELAAPDSRPDDQSAPGPGRPGSADWTDHIHR